MTSKTFSARTQPVDCWNASLVRNASYSKKADLPLFCSADQIPKGLISFKNINSASDTSQWIHFYGADNRLEPIWENPACYVERLRQFAGIISPDLSVYYDMPILLQGYNTLRNRMLAYWFSEQGIPVIPNIRWGDERSYIFSFDGIEQHKPVCVSTLGVLTNKKDRDIFRRGLDEMVRCLSPSTIIVYGQMPPDIFRCYFESGIPIIHFKSDAQKAYAGGVE